MSDTVPPAPVVTVEDLPSYWAMTDDMINSAAYTEDDDTDYNLEVGGLSIPTVWVVMLIVLLSACIGCAIFTCSYIFERQLRCGTELEFPVESDDDDEPVKVVPRDTAEIEGRLKLKKWENSDEKWEKCDGDDQTRHSSSSEEDAASIISEVSCVSCVSQMSTLMQDPAFVRLQQTPRCILCSKFFQETDTVTESWEPTCNHNFHKECIVKWLQTHDGCPVCKKAYVVGLKVEEP